MALKIIFMGTPGFSVSILKTLYNSEHKILQVYTQPPKKKNRGQKENFSPVYDFCKANDLKVKYPERLDTDEELKSFNELNPDLVIVVAYGKIIPTKLLKIENLKFINVHASLLPKWRGAAPIQRSIMSLDNETGISIMKIVPKLDAGPVLVKSKIKILKDTNFENLSDELSNLGSKLILKSIDLIENKKDKYIDQDESQASYAKKVEKSEAKINWNEKAKFILAKINALNPNPGSWFEYKGSRLKIIKAIEVEQHGKPGQIMNDKFTIACSENAIQILEIKKEGKKGMPVSEYLKGNELIIGTNVA